MLVTTNSRVWKMAQLARYMPSWGLCVAVCHSADFGRYAAAFSRLAGVHRNHVGAFDAATASPNAQHEPSRNANAATLCGVDEKDVKGNSTGIGLAAYGPSAEAPRDLEEAAAAGSEPSFGMTEGGGRTSNGDLGGGTAELMVAQS